MTRAAQVAHAVTALREAREADGALSNGASMTFRVFEDNSGRYRWTIVAVGETLVESASFASYEEAEQAAQIVHEGASSASFGENRRSDPAARNDAGATRDRLDAERWLDKGGSINGQAVTR